jgi:hypothetical protein
VKTNVYLIVAGACFLVLAALTGRHIGAGFGPVLIFTPVGLLLAVGFVAVLGMLLYAANGRARAQVGGPAFVTALSQSLLMLLPFTVLAAVAEIALGWNAVQPFMTAGVMTAAGFAGAEAMRLGGGRLTNAIVPALAGLAFTSLWLMLSTLASSLGR